MLNSEKKLSAIAFFILRLTRNVHHFPENELSISFPLKRKWMHDPHLLHSILNSWLNLFRLSFTCWNKTKKWLLTDSGSRLHGSAWAWTKIYRFRGLFTWKYVFRLEMRARKMLSTVLQAPLDMFYHQGTPWIIIKYFQLEPPIWRSKIWYLEIENYLYSYLAYPILKTWELHWDVNFSSSEQNSDHKIRMWVVFSMSFWISKTFWMSKAFWKYGTVNGIWQNSFERCDCHVVWYAFVFGIWQIRTNFEFLISLRKINHVLRFKDLTNLNCSPFLEFDTFGAIMARILSNSENDEPKWLTWWFFCSTFWRFDKFRAKIAPNVSNSKNGEQLKFVKSSKRSTSLIFPREINNFTLVRIC